MPLGTAVINYFFPLRLMLPTSTPRAAPPRPVLGGTAQGLRCVLGKSREGA